jgi:hypothetical protein
MNTTQYIVWLIFLIVALQAFNMIKDSNIIEGWTVYQSDPYGEASTGASPLTFYERNRYRKPYRWPFTFESSFPYVHEQPGP